MNRRRFLHVLTGAAVAAVASLGAGRAFAHGQGGGHHAGHHHHGKAHMHHAMRNHRHSEVRHDSHYHHDHDDHSEHDHACRLTGEVDAQSGHHKMECQGHDGGWESD